MALKTLLIAGVSLLASCVSAKGSKPPRDIKVYSIQPDVSYCNPEAAWCQGKVGLVRKQAYEVLPFVDSKGYYAVSPEDFLLLIQTCPRN